MNRLFNAIYLEALYMHHPSGFARYNALTYPIKHHVCVGDETTIVTLTDPEQVDRASWLEYWFDMDFLPNNICA